MNNKTKLSQSTAILLERARRFDISDLVILEAVRSGDAAQLRKAEAQYYDYDEFLEYATQSGEDIIQAVTDGYQMKFNTPGGVQGWLGEKWGLNPDKDFKVSPGKLTGLLLFDHQVAQLRDTLAVNWAVLDADMNEITLGTCRKYTGALVASDLRMVTLVIRALID